LSHEEIEQLQKRLGSSRTTLEQKLSGHLDWMPGSTDVLSV
jgi:hypothetical protein